LRVGITLRCGPTRFVYNGMKFLRYGLVLGCALCFARGEDRSPPTKPSIKEIGGGIWEVGRVRLNKNERVVEFPAVINMDNGIAEYLLVHVNGKIHESVLRTDIDPYQIHVAMLLLGAKGLGTNAFPETPEGRIPGEAVTIEIVWKDGKKRIAAEELIRDVKKKDAMAKGVWVYNGSLQFEGMFAAQQTGSIVSVITDPEAMINNPRPMRDDDENWVVNTKKVPKVESLVTVRIRLGK
jgi:hypothetical protein